MTVIEFYVPRSAEKKENPNPDRKSARRHLVARIAHGGMKLHPPCQADRVRLFRRRFFRRLFLQPQQTSNQHFFAGAVALDQMPEKL